MYKLQNGSDIRGVALVGVEGESINLTPRETFLLGVAFGKYVKSKVNKDFSAIKIGVGNDSRLSAQSLKNGVFKGLCSLGITVFDCGLTSTPSMFMATILDELSFDGGIMLTASHLPFNRNGMKFFTKEGGLEKADIKELITLALGEVEKEAEIKVNPCNLNDLYCEFLRNKIKEGVNAKNYDLPLEGMKIVVDAGNGAGGFFVDKVLNPLGADTTGSQFLQPDGKFPNHIPNPENKEAMAAITACVLRNKADIGIIFDTDVDRASAVDKNGREINGNAIVALMGAIVAGDYPNSYVVTDSVTSDKLTEFLENDLKLHHHRFKRGYKNVINEAISLNAKGLECHLAIETSGHCALKENHFLDDGAYLSVKVLIKAANLRKENKTIDEMLSTLQEAKEKIEIRIKIDGDNFTEYGNNVLKDFENFCKESGFKIAKNSFEGVRFNYKSGWALLRMSLHDPIMPLNIESDDIGGGDEIKNIIFSFLKKYDNLVLN